MTSVFSLSFVTVCLVSITMSTYSVTWRRLIDKLNVFWWWIDALALSWFCLCVAEVLLFLKQLVMSTALSHCTESTLFQSLLRYKLNHFQGRTDRLTDLLAIRYCNDFSCCWGRLGHFQWRTDRLTDLLAIRYCNDFSRCWGKLDHFQERTDRLTDLLAIRYCNDFSRCWGINCTISGTNRPTHRPNCNQINAVMTCCQNTLSAC